MPTHLKIVQLFARKSTLPILVMGSLASFASLSAAPPTMGVYLGSDEAAIERYEDYTQQIMAPIVTFGPMDNWEALTGRSTTTNLRISPPYGLGWGTNQFPAEYRPRVVYSIPMLPKSGASLAAGAAGSYDQQWKNVATTLIESGYQNCTLRIGWEFMGNWYPWTVYGTGSNGVANTTNFKNYWKKIVLAMRSVNGANFKFNWCGCSGDYWSGNIKLNPADAYPDPDGSISYVDEIGIDVYDKGYSGYPVDPAWPQWQKDSTRSNAWTAKCSSAGSTYNMNWWAAFAATKSRPMTIPEWGLCDEPTLPGGGDNAIFMQKMHEWLITPANNVKWHSYFQQDADGYRIKFFEKNQTYFANAITKFLSLYTGQSKFIVYQNPINKISWIGGYGTRAVTDVGTDGGTAPFEGVNQLKTTYTTNAGIQIAFPQQDLTTSTHLSLAIKGPITNSSQKLGVRLYASDGSYGPLVYLPRTTSYTVTDVTLSALTGTTLNRSQVYSIYFYASTAPVGTSDTVYIDSIAFLDKTH